MKSMESKLAPLWQSETGRNESLQGFAECLTKRDINADELSSRSLNGNGVLILATKARATLPSWPAS
jgi:hypothetical protein